MSIIMAITLAAKPTSESHVRPHNSFQLTEEHVSWKSTPEGDDIYTMININELTK